MKILINALSGIGDALMFSPALRLLKEKLPEAEIEMLVMFSSVRDMYRYSPFLNNIYFIDFLHQSKLKSIKEIFEIRRNKYDYIINTYPSNRFEYNWLSMMLGGKKRIAHHYLNTSIFRLEFLNQILVDEEKNIHNVLQNIILIKDIVKFGDEEIPPTEIFLNDEITSLNKNWIMDKIPDNKYIVGFHPGSSTLKNHIHKRWDKSKYIQLGKKLIENKNAFILLFGNETSLNKEIHSKLGINCVLASTDDYLDSLARMKYCNIFVSNDTAFMHSAAALNIPVVAIFGYTNYLELYPWKVEHKIVRKELDCSPCFFNSPKPANCSRSIDEQFICMSSIEVDEVYSACEDMMEF